MAIKLQIYRNKDAEDAFMAKLESLHSGFITKQESGSLVLRGADVLRNNWFFLFGVHLQWAQMQVLCGMLELAMVQQQQPALL